MFLCISSSELIEDSLSRLYVKEPDTTQVQVLDAWSPLPGWRTGSSRMQAGRAEERPTYAGLRDMR